MRRIVLTAAIAAALAGAAAIRAEPPYAGGETTRIIAPAQNQDRAAFSFPATNLSLTRRDNFFVGNSFFRNGWVTAPASTTARDGLGPLFNTSSCQSCHIRDGRGSPPEPGEDMVSMLVRVSIPPTGAPGEDEMLRMHGVVPEPNYGGQLQNNAILGVVPEARIDIAWIEEMGRFADGRPYRLRRPEFEVSNLGYGPLHQGALLSPRVATQMIGIGLLDTIPEAMLLANEDPDDADGDGISGRANRVFDAATGGEAIGRFGWKAGQPSARQQAASAFAGDIGITSSLFPGPLCMAAQTDCAAAPHGGEPELDDEILDMVVFYTKTLAVPGQRSHDDPFIQGGKALFHDVGCGGCHVETFTTGNDPDFPELSGQEIHPYTDLLLHDMGEGLADGRGEFDADGREWRTPPLWGVGLFRLVNLHTLYLHDGRARNIEEAILWHGGEGQAARDAYASLTAQERRQLVAFVNSL